MLILNKYTTRDSNSPKWLLPSELYAVLNGKKIIPDNFVDRTAIEEYLAASSSFLIVLQGRVLDFKIVKNDESLDFFTVMMVDSAEFARELVYKFNNSDEELYANIRIAANNLRSVFGVTRTAGSFLEEIHNLEDVVFDYSSISNIVDRHISNNQ